jgi:radical SAM superfamily enzyme YgiQ (UPF0313 family)
MNILLIDFHDYVRYLNIKQWLKKLGETATIPSLTLMQLASLTPERHFLAVLDNPSTIDFDGYYDLIGISAVTATANYSYMVADEFIKRGKTVVLGGVHPSALPEEAKQHANSVVIGEAENIWPQLIKDYEMKKLKEFYRQENPINLILFLNPKETFLKNLIKLHR